VIFGAGRLGRRTLNGLRDLGIEPFAFTDNNPELHGQQIDGVTILPPAEAAQRYGQAAAFVIAIYAEAAPRHGDTVRQQLMHLGCSTVVTFVPLYWKYPGQFLPHYAVDLPHRVIDAAANVHKAWMLLSDQHSREEFLAQLSWRLDPEFDGAPAPTEGDAYFPADLIALREDEVFVDCGAYSGDTLRSFLEHTGGHFRRSILFEPDPSSYSRLERFVASLPLGVSQRILTNQSALGPSPELVRFAANGAAFSAVGGEGGFLIQSNCLNTLLAGQAPTYIKMDIEGAEPGAVQGADELIRAYRPIVAVSAYHRQDHLWRLPLMIHDISDRYDFYLRRHSSFLLDELVLYAIPSERVMT
jgi:FkbM family methyltransferase